MEPTNIITVDFSGNADDGPPPVLPGKSASGKYWYGTSGKDPLKLDANGTPEILNEV